MQVDEVGNKAVVHLDGDKVWMSQHRMNNPKDTDDEGISTEEEEESATVRLENRPKKKTTGRKVGDDEVVVKKAWVEDVFKSFSQFQAQIAEFSKATGIDVPAVGVPSRPEFPELDPEDEEHICPVCQRKCNSYTSLKRHMRAHKGEITKYTCKKCDRKFTTKKGLKKHTPSCGKKHICDHISKRSKKKCGKQFANATLLGLSLIHI